MGGSFASRRGHAGQLSISDPSHHVTEAIGTLYGDEDENEQGRPLSFVGGSGHEEQIQTVNQDRNHLSPIDARRPLARSTSDQPQSSPQPEHGSLRKSQTLPINTSIQHNGSNDRGPHSPRSPTISLRDVQNDPNTSQFQLTDIENPNDIAQELSNLQALRRMSMDVGNMKDPDMPPMTLSNIPSMAPSGDDDEADPSRLLWVPARVHPELAPSEFQSFLETRVNSIRRRSRDSSLSADTDPGPNRSGASLGIGGGSLRRQKSTLSRQVDAGNESAASYVDGADQLARARSRHAQHNRELSLDDLVKDPTKTVKKLAEESQTPPDGAESSADDIILPMAPGMGLRRSTRTTYRKGGSLRSAQSGTSRRHGSRHQDSEASEPAVPPMPDAPPGHGLSRVQSEPISESFSRPPRSSRRPQGGIIQESPETLAALEGSSTSPEELSPASQYQDQLPIRSASTATTSASQAYEQSPDQNYGNREAHMNKESQEAYLSDPPVTEPPPKSIRRKASHNTTGQPPQPSQSPHQAPAQHAQQHPPQQQFTSKTQHQHQTQSQNLDEQLGSGPSPFPSSASGRTDNLTFIPTINEEKKPDKKSKKDDDSSSTKSSGSAWKGWFKGGNSDDKKKDDGKKSKTKQLVEKAQDNVRLDVIQSSIEKTSAPPKGRESFVLDRDAVDSKLQEERKKENNRRSDSKKEKDGSIFSSIFGGSKKKEEKDRNSKRSHHLRVPSEQPVVKHLEPDVDYHWTRFPLLEERAIYRMAHIKLANPRRPLISQVLLSNFMYSYLAIVQAMHPNMNVPVSPQQKRQEEEARRKREEEEYLAQQQADDEGMEQYDFDYHRVSSTAREMIPPPNRVQGHAQYADQGSNGSVEYVDEAQIYEDEHGDSYNQHHHQQGHHHQQHHHRHQDYGYDSQDQYDHKDYYQYHDQGGHRRHDGRDDMW